uniref:PPM-type phosphatase domain-containing protein n=1 Tax=Synechococcus leopoliensis TaxID=32047 RepID=Q9RCS9_SYNLE|nr:hypothetical protein [Synechococcus elongatus PCC 6301]
MTAGMSESIPESEASFVAAADERTAMLSLSLAQMEVAATTDVGMRRSQNEDFYVYHYQLEHLETPSGTSVQAKGLFVLCDGMGGHARGEIASLEAARVFKQEIEAQWTTELPSREALRSAVLAANQALFELNQAAAVSGSDRMGTTLVAILLQGTRVAIIHVGDSRAYRYSRLTGLDQLTRDHEVGQLAIAQGVDPDVAYARPEAHQLTQALGPRNNDWLDPEVRFLEVREDTVFLLCSDGLSDFDLVEEVTETHVAPLLQTRTSLQYGIQQLVEIANEAGGHDNITVVAVRLRLRPQLGPVI